MKEDSEKTNIASTTNHGQLLPTPDMSVQPAT